ncbi:MAG TPA: ATP synthase F1 subunit delta [Alphaproteobacteria bacterium]|mgnify:CR=1 FL=1|nr:ATP synthase F1 subunit delta [Alphaproteobacteria bacterium]
MVDNVAKIDEGVAYRYATALFELAEDSRNTTEVIHQLDSLVSWLGQQADLARFLTDPRVAPAQQQLVLGLIFKTIKIERLLEKFLLLLAKQRRFALLEQVVFNIRYLQMRQDGGVQVYVTSARSLTPTQQQKMSAMLTNKLNKKVAISFRNDPALLAGFSIQIGSKVVDSSIKSKLMRLQQMMRGVG